MAGVRGRVVVVTGAAAGKTPRRRLGEPFEVAHAVLFLAFDEARYITGHTLAVTGGR